MPTLALPGDITISEADLDRLVAGVEQYLAAAAPRPSVPRLDAAEMVRQAGIATGPAWRQKPTRGPEIDLPGRWRSLLPCRRRTTTHVAAARHLELTLEVLERYGWARTGSGVRTATGRCCILGAQLVLMQLGVGTRETLDRAGGYIQHTLRARGEKRPYPEWNEGQRTYAEVREVIATAADSARKAGA